MRAVGAGLGLDPITAGNVFSAVGVGGAIGQFEVAWSFRGGLDLRDEVMGTEGTIWINNFLRTGFEMFLSGKGAGYVAEKAESSSGWIFPVGDEVHDLAAGDAACFVADVAHSYENPGRTPTLVHNVIVYAR